MLKILDRALDFISLFALSMLMIPLSVILLGNVFPGGVYVMPLLAVLFTFLGYFAQKLNAGLMRKRASADGFSTVKEGFLEEFRLKYAAGAILTLILLGVPTTLLFDKTMNFLYSDLTILYYDVIYTVLFAVIYAICTISGAVIWFYPPSRLSNFYVLLGGVALFFVECAAALMVSGLFEETGGFAMTCAIPFMLFCVCVLIILNQSSLGRQFKGTVVSSVSSSSRLYSLLLVFALIVIFLCAAGLIYILLTGFWTIVKALLFVVLFRIFHTTATGETKEYDYVDSDEASSQFRRSVSSNGEMNIAMAALFLVVLAIVIIVGVRRGWLMTALRRLRDWIREVIDTVKIGREIFSRSFDPNAAEEMSLNYKDEKKKLQRAGIRDYEGMAEDTYGYKEFMRSLSRLGSYDEQLCYAYNVLLRMYRQASIRLKLSDTPREVEVKVKNATPEKRIEQITRDFERIRYAEEEISDTEAAAVLGNICEEVKRYMY